MRLFHLQVERNGGLNMGKGNISSLQLAMLIYPTIVATAILSIPSIIAEYAKNDLWLSPIIASLFGFLSVFIAFRLNELYPEKTFYQLSDKIIGKHAGKLVSFFIAFFYLQNTGEITRLYGEFIANSFLTKTPLIIIIGSMVILCAVTVNAGLEVMGRIAQLFFPIFFIPLIIMIILLVPYFQISNILPILENGFVPVLKGAIPPSGWFTEFFMVSFLFPFLADQQRRLKYSMFTVLSVMITMVVVNLVVLFVLGNTTSLKVYPLMKVAKYIGYADFFENLDSVVMAIWIIGAFVKITVFFYVAVIGMAHLFHLKDYRPIVWPIAVLVVQLGYWGFPNSMSLDKYDTTTFPFYAITIQILIPISLLWIALIKSKFIKNT